MIMQALYFCFVFLCTTILFSSCTPPPKTYLYPAYQDREMQRVCSKVVRRSTIRFMVNDAKEVIPLVGDGSSGPIPEFQTSLSPGGYFCGQFEERSYPCAKGKISGLTGKPCAYHL